MPAIFQRQITKKNQPSLRVMVICYDHRLLQRDSYKGVGCASTLPESILHKIIIIIIILPPCRPSTLGHHNSTHPIQTLGITFTSNFDRSNHIKNVINKGKSLMVAFNYLRRNLNEDQFLKTVANSFYIAQYFQCHHLL